MKGETKYYVSLAHTRADIDHTIGAWTEAVKELKGSDRLQPLSRYEAPDAGCKRR